jgi:hypothetical protein
MGRFRNICSKQIVILALGITPYIGTANSAEWNWTGDKLCNYCDQYAAGNARDETIRTSYAAVGRPSASPSIGMSSAGLDRDNPTVVSQASPKTVGFAEWSWSSDALCNYCDQYAEGDGTALLAGTSYKPVVGYASLAW